MVLSALHSPTLDGLVDAADAVGVQTAEAVALLVGRRRQHHVGERHHGRGHEQVLEHAEIDLVDLFLNERM